MKARNNPLFLLGIGAVALVPASADVVRHPVNAGVALEYVQMYDPINYQGANFQSPVTMMRPTGWFFQSATIDERFDVVFGLGATAFSLPHATHVGSGYENEMLPAVAMVQASGSYTWGDLDAPSLKVSFGNMPYKYNPDTKDLGEYLFRSTPYPNTVLNSPFNLVGGAQASVLGGVLSKSLAGGRWKNDLLFTSMNWTIPLYDFSAAYLTSYRFNPLLEVGAGVNLYRVLPVDAKGTTPEAANNAYYTHNGSKYATRPDYYYAKKDSAQARKADSVSNFISSGDTLWRPAGVTDINFYTYQGTMLMARFSLDLEPLLGDGKDLKVYGEWTWLGVKNYPVFFEKPVERMPVMLGVNIPTMGLLDVLGVEVEYWKNPYFNSLYLANYNSITPIPDIRQEQYLNVSLQDVNDPVKDDDFRWSVTGTKSFGKAISVTAKAAQDHPQVMQLLGAGFPGKSYGDVAATKSSWYYVLRVQMAI